MSNRFLPAAFFTMALGAAFPAAATTIVIDNVNAAGVGFNDTTPVAPVGGNSGTTLGEQRLIVFQQAANQWAALLNSSVPIKVQASMVALTCTMTSATLGSAGPTEFVAGFTHAPRANTAYNIAEGNALAGSDLDPANDDIMAQFNVSLDAGSASCLGGETWWYGIDPNFAPAANTIPLLPVVFHELGHGLGFTANISTSSGAYLTSPDTPVWADYLFDTSTNKLWNTMTNAQRLASTTNDPFLVWTGPRTNKQAGAYLKPNNALIINSPAGLAGAQEVGTAAFGPTVPASGVTGDMVLVNDGVIGSGSPAGTINDGCETPFVNSVNGSIALIDRGFCSFETKVLNAQNAGAIAAIIANNQVDSLRLPLLMGTDGSGATITIPSYSITQALGTSIKAQLGAGVNVTLGYANIGVNDGCVRMFAPSPVLAGSSVSHFHADAFPDLLMEPALNTTIFNQVDLTLPFFADIDWSTNIEDFIFLDGFDANPCQHVQP
jgi:PA domain